MVDREALILEIARCYMRAALNELLADAQNEAAPEGQISEAADDQNIAIGTLRDDFKHTAAPSASASRG